MPVNVLFLHVGENWIRGSENSLLTLLRSLDRSRIEPFLLCDQPTIAHAVEEYGIPAVVHRFPNIMMDSDAFHLDFLPWLKMAFKMHSTIRRRQIHLIYANAARPCQVAYYVAKLGKLPVICHFHGTYNRRYILLYRVNRVSKIIFPSHAVEKYTQSKCGSLPPSEVIYIGVDRGRFHPVPERDPELRALMQIPADAIVFGQVGFLVPEKGVDTLLRAFHIVSRSEPRAYLVLLGDGPQWNESVELAKQLEIQDRVRFAGYQDPAPFFQHVMDINVLASRREALGISLVEAAACGLPSIGANVEGIPEIVLDQRTGLLFEHGNFRALSEKMLELASDPSKRTRMGQAALQLVEDRFSREKYIRSIERSILETAAHR